MEAPPVAACNHFVAENGAPCSLQTVVPSPTVALNDVKHADPIFEITDTRERDARRALRDLTFPEVERLLVAEGLRAVHARALWRMIYRDGITPENIARLTPRSGVGLRNTAHW